VDYTIDYLLTCREFVNMVTDSVIISNLISRVSGMNTLNSVKDNHSFQYVRTKYFQVTNTQQHYTTG